MEEVDITIIGAGVVGLSCAYVFKDAGKSIVVLERNRSFGEESSSRNSEVVHAGIYYPPGSLKAQTCLRGRELLYDLCQRHRIPFRKTGKLVVAYCDDEIGKLKYIYDNALHCGVNKVEFLETAAIKKLEPGILAKSALFFQDSGIMDTHSFMDFLYHTAKSAGVMFSFHTELLDMERKADGYEVVVKEPEGSLFSFRTQVVINAAGLHADKVAEYAGIDTERHRYKIHYCKGQYFRIRNPGRFSVSHLVYPPPTNVSLGIHITPDLAGGLRLGPDANYIPEIDYNVDEQQKSTFYESVKKFLPQLESSDLIPDTAGVRPKLQAEDEEFRDFVVSSEEDKGFPGLVNLIGIESPGFTSSLAIAAMVRDKVKF